MKHAQQVTLIYAVMMCVVVLLLMQFFLLMVAVEEFMGGRAQVLWPAAFASGVCFVGSFALIRVLLHSLAAQEVDKSV
jgi:hypothetical protein